MLTSLQNVKLHKNALEYNERLPLSCVASVSVGFRGKELTREKREGRFWLSAQFRVGKIPFLGLSLLPNTTETLATQARLTSEKPTAFEALNKFEASTRRSHERTVIVQ